MRYELALFERARASSVTETRRSAMRRTSVERARARCVRSGNAMSIRHPSPRSTPLPLNHCSANVTATEEL